MNSILKFLVPVCCIALSSAVEVVIPGYTPELKFDVPLTPAQVTACPTFIESFKTQYTTSPKCVTSASETAQWNNFKLGFSDVKDGTADAKARDFGTSKVDCDLKDGGSALQKEYCAYIKKVVDQCRCDTTTCIAGDLMGKISIDNTDKRGACYAVPKTMCDATQTAMNTPCQAAISAAAPKSNEVPFDKTKVVLKCAPADCPPTAVEVEIPGSDPMLKLNVPLTPAEVESCPTYIDGFRTQYTTPSADCGGAAFVTKQWNNFKLGFSDVKVGTGTEARDFGTSYEDCKAKHATDKDNQLIYCDYINHVATQCRCDTTTCIAGDLVAKVTTEKKTACYGVPTSMCELTQPAMNTGCQAAVSKAVTGISDVTYAKAKVVLKCAKEDCPKKPQEDTSSSSTTAAPTRASGALGLTAMVAFVTMTTAIIVV